MRAEKLVNDYARAIYDAAFDKWVFALKQVRDGLKADPPMAFLLTDPNKDEEAKRALLRGLLPEGAMRELENIVLLLAREGHLGMLDDIIDEFEQLVTMREASVPAVVTTAVPLSDSEKTAMRDKLARLYGSHLDFDFVVDPDVLGGVVVRFAGKVIDDSVAAKLAELRVRLGVASR